MHPFHPARLWLLLDEPRVQTALRMVFYSILVAGGAGAFGTPPSSLSAAWGDTFTDIWAGLLIAGGVIGLAAAPRGIWWAERIGITVLVTGLSMYLSVVVTLHITSPGNRAPQASVIAALIVLLIMRWLSIRRAALDPTSGPTGYRPDHDA